MPRIANIGFADWAGNNTFDIEERVLELSGKARTSSDSIHPTLDASAIFVRLELHKEIRRRRLRLCIRLTFDEKLPIETGLLWAFTDGVLSTNVDGCSYWIWSTESIAPEDRTGIFREHPLFRIVDGLSSLSKSEVEVWLKGDGTATSRVIFYHNETITKPSRFLAALCNKMAKWASAVPA